jgi:hypothetical protein
LLPSTPSNPMRAARHPAKLVCVDLFLKFKKPGE